MKIFKSFLILLTLASCTDVVSGWEIQTCVQFCGTVADVDKIEESAVGPADWLCYCRNGTYKKLVPQQGLER